MRRQSFVWTFLVLAIVLTAYGCYAVINAVVKQENIPILGLVFLIVGSAMLVLFLILLVISIIQKRNKRVVEKTIIQDEIKEEPVEEKIDEVKSDSTNKPSERTYRNDVTYERQSSSSRSYLGSAYINKVGYGPVLRVEEEQILDMRSNTYYRLEGNIVKMSGSGPVFEISGNKIKAAFGGYLYEISGGSINKIYGGYFASISGGYIQTYNLSEKYEVSGSLTLKQQLAVAAILFGTY